VRDGTRLGRYEIHSVLGRGGMGEVWRAGDTKLNRDIAIKMLPEPFARNAQRLARLEREAQWPASSNVLLITPDEGRVVVEGGVRIDEWSSLTTG
jgi:serine/threonine protein kinase